MFRNPVLALDASPFADVVTATGLLLAKQLGATTLHGLHVVDLMVLEGGLLGDLGGSMGLEPIQNVTAELDKLLSEKARLILERFAARCRDANVPFTTTVERGMVAATIAAAAASRSVAILGRQGEAMGRSDDQVGGTVEAVARRAPVPVWVTGAQAPAQLGSIVVGYDQSPRAGRALELALDLAEAGGARIAVVAAGSDEEARRRALDQARGHCGGAKTALKFLESGAHPVDALLQAVQDEQADLLAIGAFGHNRLVEWVLGSTTDVLLRKCPSAVLLGR